MFLKRISFFKRGKCNCRAAREKVIASIKLSSPTETKQEFSPTFVLSVTAILLAAKISYDLSWHNTYATRTQNWYEILTRTIERNDITSIEDSKLISPFSAVDHDEILQMHIWVNNAYNNWLTPWNWTGSLKTSFQNLQIIEILTLYADLIAKKDTVTGTEVVKSFRSKYSNSSTYPLIFAYTNMDNHIQFIRKLQNHPLQKTLTSAIEYLNNFKILLRQENEYQQEIQTKRTNDLQEEMIGAIRSR